MCNLQRARRVWPRLAQAAWSLVVLVALVSSAGSLRPVAAEVAALSADRIADRLLGQPDCASNASNNPAAPIGGLSARSLNSPYGVAVDAGSGRLYVADTFNNRVLSWPSAAAFETGQAADLVLGQPGFTTNAEAAPPSATSLNKPIGLAVDTAGNLYVADQLNNRVLVFNSPATTNTQADRVYGQQGDFATSTPNRGGLGAGSLEAPRGVAVLGNQWVAIADTGNHRVLLYPGAATTATRVLGQPNFISQASSQDTGTSATSLFDPVSVAVNTLSRLFVADQGNHRVLRFDDPFSGLNPAADGVLGQADFAGNLENRGASDPSAGSLWAPAGLALDSGGHLLVADSLNYRVLAYAGAAGLANGAAASQVFGQPSLTSGEVNVNGPSASSLAWVNGVAIDAAGSVYVADTNNHRLLAYDVRVITGCHVLALPALQR